MDVFKEIKYKIFSHLESMKQCDSIYGGVFIEKTSQKYLVGGVDNIDFKLFFSVELSSEALALKSEAEIYEFIKSELEVEGLTILAKEEFEANMKEVK